MGEDEKILDIAQKNNIELPHSCQLGVCMSCCSKILSGEVDQSEGTLEESKISKGYALICSSYPRSDIILRPIEENEI